MFALEKFRSSRIYLVALVGKKSRQRYTYMNVRWTKIDRYLVMYPRKRLEILGTLLRNGLGNSEYVNRENRLEFLV